MKYLKKIALPLVGLIVGAMFFFPWNDVRDLISTQVQKASGVQIQMQSFSPTLGLRMGLSKGSLLAFSAYKSSIRLPSGQSISCNELLIGPRFWPLLMAKAQISIGCISEDGGQMTALVSASPVWAPSSVSAGVDLSYFSLENVDLQTNIQGILSGSLDVAGINIQEAGGIPDVSWDLTGSKVRTPEANIPLLKLPGLDLGDIETNGSISARAIKISQLKFGSKQTLIEGKINFQSDIAAENMMPMTGDIAGTLRVDPSAEKSSLRDVPWKTFGNADENGKREFKRSFTGGIQNLFFSLPGS